MSWKMFRSRAGQIVPLYAIALPVVLGMFAFALDVGKLYVFKIHVQNAADAGALASVQDLGDYLNGTATEAETRPIVTGEVNNYVSRNFCDAPSRWLQDPAYPTDKRRFRCQSFGASLGECALAWDAYPNNQLGRQQRSEDTNCYTWPYIKNGTPHWDRLEVRLTRPVNLEFAGLVHFTNPSYQMKRSVATYTTGTTTTVIDQPESTLVYTDPDTTNTITTVIDGTTFTTTTVTPGDTHTTVTPETTVTNVETTSHFEGGTGAVAFVKSRDCLNAPATANSPAGAAMQWSGAPSSLNQLLVNGGIAINGNNTHHSDHIWLGKRGVAGCEQYGPGANVTQFTGPFAPMDWPVTPPPAPPAGCISTGTGTITAAWLTPQHGPGRYCWTGLLTISANGTTFNGYSFYAPNIHVNSKGMTITAATPPAGEPPTVFYAYGYDVIDPATGLDACGPGAFPQDPSNCAFAFNGQSDTITGDIFVPNGSISMSGGAATTANGGTGFMESLKLIVSGNFSNYNGTGPGDGGTITTTTETTTTVIPATTQVTTDPDTTVTITTVTGGTTTTTETVIPGATHTTTIPGTTGTVTSTTSTDLGLGE
jgi:hypothetical protein